MALQPVLVLHLTCIQTYVHLDTSAAIDFQSQSKPIAAGRPHARRAAPSQHSKVFLRTRSSNDSSFSLHDTATLYTLVRSKIRLIITHSRESKSETDAFYNLDTLCTCSPVVGGVEVECRVRLWHTNHPPAFFLMHQNRIVAFPLALEQPWQH